MQIILTTVFQQQQDLSCAYTLYAYILFLLSKVLIYVALIIEAEEQTWRHQNNYSTDVQQEQGKSRRQRKGWSRTRRRIRRSFYKSRVWSESSFLFLALAYIVRYALLSPPTPPHLNSNQQHPVHTQFLTRFTSSGTELTIFVMPRIWTTDLWVYSSAS